MPKISVIMPVYNSEKYLREAMDSILNQTFSDFEFIIIDDGSSDTSPEIVRSYDDPRIRFYQNEHNMGVAATLNRGLDLAVGEYIARMDSDDISLPERFEKQVKYMDGHMEVGVCGGAVYLFDGKRDYKVRTFSTEDYQVAVDLVFNCALVHPTAMIRSSILSEESIRYQLEFEGCEDYRLWCGLIRCDAITNLPDILLHYRKHGNQVTATVNERLLLRLSQVRESYLRSYGVLTTQKELCLLQSFSLGEREFVLEDIQILYNLFLRLSDKISAKYKKRCSIKAMFGTILFSIDGVPLWRCRKLLTWKTIILQLFRKKR